MPGRRNFARERAQHARDAPAKQAALYRMLRDQLPDKDRAFVGYPAILRYLHDLGIRRLNAGPLTDRIVRSWQPHGFPVVSGRWHPSAKTPSVTSSHAVLAWLLTRPFDTGDLFTVVAMAQASPPMRSFPAHQKAQQCKHCRRAA